MLILIQLEQIRNQKVWSWEIAYSIN